jgi:Lipocalin-like domain
VAHADVADAVFVIRRLPRKCTGDSLMPPQANGGELVGTWQLISCFMEDVETKERNYVWGKRPNGRLVLTPTSHWLVVQTAQGRKAPQTDEDRSAAFRSMMAYCGQYRIDGRKIIIDVEIAWDESWIGTEQVRYFSIEGERLHIEAPPQSYPNLGTKPMRAVLTWQRAA